MGMDLKPIAPAHGHPHDDYGPVWGRYNIWGWGRQYELLQQWGVAVPDWPWCNDGDEIPAEACCAISKAIQRHAHELIEPERDWLLHKEEFWRTCGGCEVW